MIMLNKIPMWWQESWIISLPKFGKDVYRVSKFSANQVRAKGIIFCVTLCKLIPLSGQPSYLEKMELNWKILWVSASSNFLRYDCVSKHSSRINLQTAPSRRTCAAGEGVPWQSPTGGKWWGHFPPKFPRYLHSVESNLFLLWWIFSKGFHQTSGQMASLTSANSES